MKSKNYPIGSITATVALLGVCALAPQKAEAKKRVEVSQRPNVILINCDDLGWGDPSCYGGELFETPNIDRLASEGIQCTNGYVSAPVSGVSRVGLLTGSYQQRYGMQWNHDQWSTPGRKDPLLSDNHKQIQSAFKEAGYVTAIAGKIGINNAQSFDNYYSYVWNGTNYFPDVDGRYVAQPGEKSVAPIDNIYWGDESKGEYITDKCTRQCIEFIEDNKENPFFFYMAYNAPHTPLHAKLSDKYRVAHIESEVAQVYAAMVLALDDNIGRLLDYLDDEGLRESTIVVFLSDNGPANPCHLSIPSWWPTGAPYHVLGQRNGLNGYKGTMWDGGIRVPYIVSWPGKLPQGKIYDNAVSTLDIYPTLCSAARVAIPENTNLDGVDLMPFLTGGYERAPHKSLFWYANRMGAIRSGKWKMLIEEDYHYLFDLENDREESKNVMKENPEVMQELLAAYFDFRNQMPAYRNPFARPIDIKDPTVVGLPTLDPK